ncbi:hypothetical protein [Micromonospora sp. HK10]|uniref:hypothetical protein n=1 Tax=Micromonospora sp. HK10 TaxID=1538294 RepID=UPI00062727DF|nr:hypothetical protein [Micromonospora sp. HK10]KKK04873.1 hypothetical protein LQ51_17280 [Micromonospora sp. HK10]
MTVELARLAELGDARIRLDERELELIDRARYAGATWAEIAAVLGLGSRQAAEQRRQRLAAAQRSRRRELDLRYSARIAALRAAVSELRRWIDADRAWDTRFPRAALVRRTAEHARDAAPGSLYALARHLVDDLAGAAHLQVPAPARAAVTAMEAVMSTRD